MREISFCIIVLQTLRSKVIENLSEGDAFKLKLYAVSQPSVMMPSTLLDICRIAAASMPAVHCFSDEISI